MASPTRCSSPGEQEGAAPHPPPVAALGESGSARGLRRGGQGARACLGAQLETSSGPCRGPLRPVERPVPRGSLSPSTERPSASHQSQGTHPTGFLHFKW